jgi:hypothetical protein
MAMIAAAADLQKAIFSALGAESALTALLGGAKVFDRAPANVRFPYVTFGMTGIYDWSTATENGAEQLFTLHVWSKTQGKKETLDIMEAIRARLDGPLVLEAHRLVALRLDYSEARYDEDLLIHHGLLRFRAMIEEDA